jgi:hypothetical protein
MANTTTTTYSASNVTVTYGGHVFTGFGSGDDVIQVSRREDSVQLDIGMQGDGVYSQSTDRSGELTISLLAGSATNDFLTAKANANDVGSIFSAPLIITEVGSETKVTADKCVIQKVPDLNRGAKAGEVEWVFVSPTVISKQGRGTEI